MLKSIDIKYYLCYNIDKIRDKNTQKRSKIMTRYNAPYTLDQSTLDAIAMYMDDDIRETVHAELAPCTPDEFLIRYVELDPDFADLLDSEFCIII